VLLQSIYPSFNHQANNYRTRNHHSNTSVINEKASDSHTNMHHYYQYSLSATNCLPFESPFSFYIISPNYLIRFWILNAYILDIYY